MSRSARAGVGLPLLIAAAAAVAALQLAHVDRQRRDARLRAHAAEVVRAVQTRVSDYTDVLYGIRGLFAARGAVSPAQFHAHVRALELAARYPGARGVGVARRAGGRLIVDHVEPRRGNRSALGADLDAWPDGRRAARRAFATGRPAVTAPIELRRGRGSGFLVFLPVRARTFDGVAIVMVQTAGLMRDAVTGAPAADLALSDLGPDGDGGVGRAGPASPTFATSDGAEAAPHGERTTAFAELGRRWALRYAPREPVLGAAERAAPWILLVTGLLLAALAAALLRESARTERRALALATRMTADLRRKEADLERSNAELERFASVASHDLREPLRSVTGFVRLLERRQGPRLDPEARAWISAALDGTRRMSELIGDLLEHSRAGAGDEDEDVSGDLALAWELAARNLAAAIRDARATVTAGPLPRVAATQSELNQVVQNLLANAIKYRGEAPPVVRAEAERRGRDWALSVTDNGIGIDPRHHEEVFVLFARLHRDDEYEGTGIGLSLCKRLVEARGGRISVQSAAGEGARFTVVLPAARAERPALRAA